MDGWVRGSKQGLTQKNVGDKNETRKITRFTNKNPVISCLEKRDSVLDEEEEEVGEGAGLELS